MPDVSQHAQSSSKLQWGVPRRSLRTPAARANVPRPRLPFVRVMRRTWALVLVAVLAGCGPGGVNNIVPLNPEPARAGPPPSVVRIEDDGGNRFQYLVNGQPQLFIGMGYNPIYRNLSDAQRAANYQRDFRILCQAGVNTITGWDRDKGYNQDQFDEITLDEAYHYGLGVVMPFYLPPHANYTNTEVRHTLMERAIAKIERFKDHPALRMWGVGNEVLTEMPQSMYPAFGSFYLELADKFHELDPNHPVIYREAEDVLVGRIARLLQRSGDPRPWLLYGMNVYSLALGDMLQRWPENGLDKPLFVSEFGAEAYWFGSRATGYVNMWRTIRSFPDRKS